MYLIIGCPWLRPILLLDLGLSSSDKCIKLSCSYFSGQACWSDLLYRTLNNRWKCFIDIKFWVLSTVFQKTICVSILCTYEIPYLPCFTPCSNERHSFLWKGVFFWQVVLKGGAHLGIQKNIYIYIIQLTLHKKWSFPLTISSVNVTTSAGNCGFGHIYWRNP